MTSPPHPHALLNAPGTGHRDRIPPLRPIRVVYVITRSDSIGGGHIHNRDLAVPLPARGPQAIVLVGQEGPLTQEVARSGIPYHSLRPPIRPIHPLEDA